MILLKANDELKMVFGRMLKTMGVNVAWTGNFVVLNNFLILSGSVRSLIFNFDNRKVLTNIIELPDREEDMEPVEGNEILTNVLNMTLYAFGKWGVIKGLKVDQDYSQLNGLFYEILKDMNITPGFRDDNFRFYKERIQTYSVFLCGPQQMYRFVDKELEKLGLERKYIRHELFGEFHDPKQKADYPSGAPDTVRIAVTVRGETRTVTGSANDSILQTLERSGIAVPSRCRSGECGWCHSRLISGKVYIPKALDGRRLADEKYSYIHPCCTFPISDIAIEVPAAK